MQARSPMPEHKDDGGDDKHHAAFGKGEREKPSISTISWAEKDDVLEARETFRLSKLIDSMPPRYSQVFQT